MQGASAAGLMRASIQVRIVRILAQSTLRQHGLTEETYRALWESQGGCCAICGISEAELKEKRRPLTERLALLPRLADSLPSEVAETLSEAEDLPIYLVLHIDHEHGSSPPRVRGLLCAQCNFDLEAFIRNRRVVHPGKRGVSVPRKDPRFVEYLRLRAPPG